MTHIKIYGNKFNEMYSLFLKFSAFCRAENFRKSEYISLLLFPMELLYCMIYMGIVLSVTDQDLWELFCL